MTKPQFTDSQIINATKRAKANLAVPELCRELEVNSAHVVHVTLEVWRNECHADGLDENASNRARTRTKGTRPKAAQRGNRD